jgi:hypothetical protein
MNALQGEFAGEWTIWRALSAQRTNRDWCARRIDTEGAPTRLSAATAEELRERIMEAAR